MQTKPFGIELVLDLHGCDQSKFSESGLRDFLQALCDLIDMERHGEPHFWAEYADMPHMNGISCFQFIRFSNIVVHTLNLLDAVYINIFSCKPFDTDAAARFAQDFFKARQITARVIDRI